MRKVVALTGGSGLLSVNLALLMAKECDVYLFLHNRNINLPIINTLFVDLDSISELSYYLQLLKIDILFNCAALTNVETCEKDPELALHINSIIAGNIALACHECGVKLVHISTDHLFDGTTSFYSETSTVTPLNSYGYSKAYGEERVLSSCPDSLVIRTNFFGWGLPYRMSFSDLVIDNYRNKVTSYLFTDVYYTPVIISQLLLAINKLIEIDCNGIFHISSAQRISKYQFGCFLAEVFLFSIKSIKPVQFSSRNDLTQRPCDMSLSNKKLLSIFPDYTDNVKEHIKFLHDFPSLLTNFSFSN